MSKQELLPTLLNKNKHMRDNNIVFYEEGHKYEIAVDKESQYTSVTTWNHSHFAHFDADEIIKKMMNGKNWNSTNKYWGMTENEIKEQWNKNRDSVAEAGTNMHYEIECFMNRDYNSNTHEELLNHYLKYGCKTNDSDEWNYFLEFVKKFPDLKPYRTEWIIYNEDLKLAGSIDMVYENSDNTLSIYDWKRSKDISKINGWNKTAITECINHLPDTNYWHYCLQLNTYKAMLELKYDKKVKDLFLVRLHPDNPKKTFDLIKVVDLSQEINDLFEYRKQQISKNEK